MHKTDIGRDQQLCNSCHAGQQQHIGMRRGGSRLYLLMPSIRDTSIMLKLIIVLLYMMTL